MKNEKQKNNNLTYISLFSSAGIGCYGFKKANFDCVASIELLKKRIDIQKANKKCRYETGYICGDINDINVFNLLINEVEKWKLTNNIDVLIATPPCQGMSVANQKKCNEMKRNSLVVRAIEGVITINPKIFIFENVNTFLKTLCTGKDGQERIILEEIENQLGEKYIYSSRVINFKNYGCNSSRTRTLVIGVRKDIIEKITPFEIFPNFEKEKTLRQVIGHYKSLTKMNEYDENNFLHHFKEYDKRMMSWIKNLKQGESAFDAKNNDKKPHKLIENEIVFYKKGFGDKYKRQYWDKVAPCIHTANDCLASQNTIHPIDNRVFSIAELMEIMTIPSDFCWDTNDLNKLDKFSKIEWLKKNQGNIRKCIGEAVPTGVFFNIANNIKNTLCKNNFYDESMKFEKENILKDSNAAFYTTREILNYIYNNLPDFPSNEINILEPSVGMGNFLIPIFKKYQNEKVNLTVIDIDKKSILSLKKMLKKYGIPKNFNIEYICGDFLKMNLKKKYDLVIGNPPFKSSNDSEYKNLFEGFWYFSKKISNNIMFINPKYLLFSPKYKDLRIFLNKLNIDKIIDFGEMGFKGVKIETILISVTNRKNEKIFIESIPKKIKIFQDKNYIFDFKLPYWIIYRNKKFDYVYNKMKKDIFYISKNYEISNQNLSSIKQNNKVWIIRSKNINIKKPEIIHINNYDKYADKDVIRATKFYKYINSTNSELYLVPTLTYYPRIVRMPKNIFVNGSVLIAHLKDPHFVFTDKDISYYYSDEFRKFYSIAFNYSTRTLNVDSNTIKFFGVIR